MLRALCGPGETPARFPRPEVSGHAPAPDPAVRSIPVRMMARIIPGECVPA
jgi:hypothetical protein